MTEWYWPRYAVKVEVVEIMGTGKCPGRLKVGDSWVWKWNVPEGMCPWLAFSFSFFENLYETYHCFAYYQGEDRNIVTEAIIIPHSTVYTSLRNVIAT
ncbi:unnamed protein product [marine sediment metagenome]|uniref:Uncharacterized protein n=1 Tax=marine sediment metagenome TaxID=412755 RepID=X1SVS2_9ZZZZ